MRQYSRERKRLQTQQRRRVQTNSSVRTTVKVRDVHFIVVQETVVDEQDELRESVLVLTKSSHFLNYCRVYDVNLFT